MAVVDFLRDGKIITARPGKNLKERRREPLSSLFRLAGSHVVTHTGYHSQLSYVLFILSCAFPAVILDRHAMSNVA